MGAASYCFSPRSFAKEIDSDPLSVAPEGWNKPLRLRADVEDQETFVQPLPRVETAATTCSSNFGSDRIIARRDVRRRDGQAWKSTIAVCVSWSVMSLD